MASITVSCPSCESEFAVKDTLIGKKVDCPKCKYRFKADVMGADDDKPAKSKKTAKKSGGNMLVVGGIIGVLAIILLGVGGYFIFAGGDSKPSTTKPSGGSGTTASNTNNAASSSAGTPAGGTASTTTSEGGTASTTPENGGTTTTTPEGVKSTPSVAVGDLKNATNLLPGETIRIISVHVDRIINTPLYSTLFDKNTQEFFKRSLSFEASDIQTYIHAVVNPDRTNFGIFRLKKPIDQQLLLNSTDNIKGPQSPIQGKYYYNTLKSNAFIDAIGRSLSAENLADEFGVPLTEEEKKKKQDQQVLAYCVIDSHTLIVADQLQLERFLNDLDPKGNPPFKSELTPDGPAPTEPMNPGTGGEAAPEGKGASPGMGFRIPKQSEIVLTQGQGRGKGGVPGRPDGAQGGIGGEGAPVAGGGQGQSAPRKSFTSNPDYRTVDEELKYMMNRLGEEDPANPPLIIFAEKLDQRIFNQRFLNAMFRATNDAIIGLLSQMKVFGATVRVFNRDKFVASAAFEFQHEEDARVATGKFIMPILERVVPLLGLILGTPVDIRNNAGAGGQGGPGGLSPEGGGGRGRGGPPTSGGPPPGIMGAGPGGPGGRGAPIGGEGVEGGPGGNPNGSGSGSGSHVNVSLSDKATIVAAEILWNEERYKKTVLPAIVSLTTQLKGRMAVLSGETTWHSLASQFPALIKDKKAFPRGTIERELKADRYGLSFPPEQRVSFLADLLPYLSKGGLRSTIKADKFPWYSKENVTAAESWIPEFLVPYYPQTSWRAYHPLAEGKVLGATNFVGLSGLGLDSARFNPSDPQQAKKVGITGYNWGSTPSEITDGMSNTIYMIQAPPGLTRPWIAGGGATLMGVDDQAANPALDFVHTAQDKRRGTYVLMADGSVRWITESIDPKVFKGMVTRAGGENLGDLDKLAPKVDPPKKTNVEIRGGANAAPAPTGTTPPPVAADALDTTELAKFQGDWKITMLYQDGKKLPTEQLDSVGLTMKIEGDIIRFESKTPLPIALPSAKISSINVKATPKQVTAVAQDGPTKDKASTSVYEFVGPLKLKMRSGGPTGALPKNVRIPEEGSKDMYIELEKPE